jgi:hypothetical protein
MNKIRQKHVKRDWQKKIDKILGQGSLNYKDCNVSITLAPIVRGQCSLVL